MAAAEPYDYLPGTAVVDYDYTLTITAQESILEKGGFPGQKRHVTDGHDFLTTTPNTTPVWILKEKIKNKAVADIGTMFDLYFDTAKAKGMARSFKRTHQDGHTYIVKFNLTELERQIKYVAVHGFTVFELVIIDKV